MSSQDKTILVTGADGFIGSHLTEQLVRRGYKVRAFICYNSYNSWGNLDYCPAEVKSEIEAVSGDIRDAYCVKNAMRGSDIVLHLAALIAIPFHIRPPAHLLRRIFEVLSTFWKQPVILASKVVVHTSTSEVYGSAKVIPISEDHPLQGQSPYSATKIGADQLALSFYNSFATPVTIIRPFNTYGPRQSARAIIPATIIQIASGQSTIKLGSLSPTRDFNYVLDTVRGFIAAAESQQSNGEVINIGSGFEISIGDTVNLIAQVMGAKIAVETDSARLRPEKSEVTRLLADNRKAKAILDWTPEYGGVEGLRRGLRETVDWFLMKENLSAYKPHVYNV